MMAITYCFEDNECFNIALYHDDNIVIFEASRPIRGGDMLIADCGDEDNNELLMEREAARKRRVEELESRPHLSHSYKCRDCGHTCAPKFCLRHQNICKKTKAEAACPDALGVV